MLSKSSLVALFVASLATATPINPRQVPELNQEATEEAHVRDDGATRAFSDIQIRSADGRCLFVDPLSGDFRANLTPVQLAECGTTDGQGWDIITEGLHNDQPGQMLVVSTLTQACLNFDPRRAAGNQVLLFSCGGRADGGGAVTTSQLFAFDGSAGPLSLEPNAAQGNCVTVAGDVLDIANCADGTNEQFFTFGEGEAGNGGNNGNVEAPVTTIETPDDIATITTSADVALTTSTEAAITVPADVVTSTAEEEVAEPTFVPGRGDHHGFHRFHGNDRFERIQARQEEERIPVAGDGGFLQPDQVAKSHKFDGTATRVIQSINIQSPGDSRCLSIDVTAGDFRQNLIPVAMVECADVREQKFDIITKGVHNNGNDGRVLIASNLMEGCISFDAREKPGNTVNIFSCGGRAEGDGETDFAQLYPFDEGTGSILLEPQSGNGEFCLVAGETRLDSAPCAADGSQNWNIMEM